MLLSRDMLPKLTQVNDKRVAFKEGLAEFTKWLFEQCTQPRAQARLVATKLFDELCPKLRGSADNVRC